MTREQWLNISVKELSSLFSEHGYTIPQVYVSVGFPGGGSAHKRIGEHWAPETSSNKIGQIFINPILDTPFKMLDVLTHELVHAAVGNKAGHGPIFKICALKVGLTGKMRSTVSGPILTQRLNAIIGKLGPIDHGTLNLSTRKKQGTRMVKMECKFCGYVARTTKKWIDEVGPLICTCIMKPMNVEVKEND